MAKKKVSEVNKKEQAELEKNFAAYLEILKALNAEHGFQPTAVLSSDDKGIYSRLSFEQYVTPKTNDTPDSDDKGTEDQRS